MLRKIAILATGTVGGVVAVVAYHPPQLHSVNAIGVAPTPAPNTGATGSTGTTGKTGTPGKTGTTGSTSATTAPTTTGKSGVFAGATANTQWGPVQVQITVTNGKITAVSALQYPNGDQRSKSIAQQSIPYLIQQTIATQKANVAGVSGASYTSDGWRRSLASAIAKAGI
jgi:uncharacterized protein with FMN-binding domain